MAKEETTSLEVLDIILRALLSLKLGASGIHEKIEAVNYDGDNHDGCIQLTLKDNTIWFISSNDIKSDDDLLRDK